MKKQMVLFAALMTMFVSGAQANTSTKMNMDDPAVNPARAAVLANQMGNSSCPLANKNAAGSLNEDPKVEKVAQDVRLNSLGAPAVH